MIKREDKHFVVSAIAGALGVGAATVLAGVSAAATVAGTAATVNAQMQAAEQQEKALAAAEEQQAASLRAEKIRKAQMEAEAREARIRAERERRMNVARSVASVTNSGAAEGSSAFGAVGTALSTAATNDRQAGTALTHGQQMFEANAAYSIAGGQVAQAQGQAQLALGQGQMIAGVAAGFGSLANIGTSLFNQTNMGSWTTTTQKASS